jgi:hypothetical protein
MTKITRMTDLTNDIVMIEANECKYLCEVIEVYSSRTLSEIPAGYASLFLEILDAPLLENRVITELPEIIPNRV